MKLSERVRPDVECAPWVIAEIKRLEHELSEAYTELSKLMPRAIFDRDVWLRAREHKS